MRLHRWILIAFATLFGCDATTTTTSPEPAPTPDSDPELPPMRVSEAAPAHFLDPERRAKLESAFGDIEKFVSQRQEDRNVPGLAFGVVIDGELALSGGYGVADTETKMPVGTKTAFRVGSITKVFTALTVLQLRDRGELDIDDPVAKYLPELGGVVYPSDDVGPIRFSDLMSHTSGLARLGPKIYGDGVAPTETEVLDSLDGFTLSRAPAIEYQYSNLGFGLLGLALARVTDMPARRAITKALLEPLGMTGSAWEPADIPPEYLAQPHRHDEKTGELVPRITASTGPMETAGGLYSTIEDLARFATWQLDAWPPRSGEPDPILARATSREAQTIHFALGRSEDAPVGVGWAWHVYETCYGHVVRHNGAIDGFKAGLDLMPRHGVAVIVLMNGGSAQPEPMVDEIWRLLHATGGLQARVASPHPTVRVAAEEFVGLINAWNAETYATRASETMRKRTPAARLERELAWEHEQLGECRLGNLRESADNDQGEYDLVCDNATARLGIDVEIRGDGSRWRGFSLTEFVEPHEDLQTAAASVTTLLRKWDARKFERTFAAHWAPDRIQSFFTRTNETLGPCKLGESRFVRGPHIGEYLLECEKQQGKLFLSLKGDEDAKIGGIRILPIEERECAPRSKTGA